LRRRGGTARRSVPAELRSSQALQLLDFEDEPTAELGAHSGVGTKQWPVPEFEQGPRPDDHDSPSIYKEENLSGRQLAALRASIAPAWGRKLPLAGRVAHVSTVPEFQATTKQACGLNPFMAGSGTPTVGVPMGRHLLNGEVFSYDPIGWLVEGLTTNPGCFLLGQPGCGKSSFVKRLMRGMAGFGVTPWVVGDVKPDYPEIVRALGGTVIRVGRGLDTMNPLDTGPLGQAAQAMAGAARQQLRAEIRGRRLNALLALLSLVREYRISNGEENVLGAILDILDERLGEGSGPQDQPTVPDVLAALRSDEHIERLMVAADVHSRDELLRETKPLKQTLNLLCEGSLKGVFDGPTSRPIDLHAPAVCIDISNVASAGDTIVAAAMLSTWAYAFSSIDGANALADAGLAPRRQFLTILDELWKALRGCEGLVEAADALTRVNRAKGVGDVRATHSLQDLEALPSAADVAKARGFVERAGVVVLGALSPRELRDVSRVVPLTDSEMELVSGWSAPDSWTAGSRHPGRGKYLLKTGNRIGIPFELDYVGNEAELYNTDLRMLDPRMSR
jgi:hypothetical protein